MEFDEQLMMDFNGAIILKYNNTSKYSAIFDSGISVTVEEVEGILQMMLLVPPIFKGGYHILLPNFFRRKPCLVRIQGRSQDSSNGGHSVSK